MHSMQLAIGDCMSSLSRLARGFVGLLASGGLEDGRWHDLRRSRLGLVKLLLLEGEVAATAVAQVWMNRQLVVAGGGVGGR